ncbi:MAG: CHASE3 domain-containing protein [Anaerolineae bacterium]|nr:CHASE3 domain-containing protein [Gloeobacterales cyanobacterium ES-bin-313]
MTADVKKRGRSIAQRLIYGLGATLTIMTCASAFGQWLVSNQVEALRQSYRQSQQLNANISDMLAGMIDQEAGERGFIITHDEAFLKTYYKGREKFYVAETQARQLLLTLAAETNEDLIPELNAVEDSAKAWYTHVQTAEMEPIWRKDYPKAVDQVRSRVGKNLFQRFRDDISKLEKRHSRLVRKLEALNLSRQLAIDSLSFGIVLTSGIFGALIALDLVRDLKDSLGALEETARSLSAGDISARVPEMLVARNNELALFAGTFNAMAEQLGTQTAQLLERDILNELRALDAILVEEVEIAPLCERLLEKICELTEMELGALFLMQQDRPFLQCSRNLNSIESLESLLSAAIYTCTPITLSAPDTEGIALKTATGEIKPQTLSVWPLISNLELVAVLFVGGSINLRPQARYLLESISSQIAVALLNSSSVQMIADARFRLEATNKELERQRRQIELQNQDLLEADRQKNRFLASMSHELRTPLNAIIGFSQLLLRNQSIQGLPQVLFQLERIYQNGKIQLRLVNDILDLAKIKAGKADLQYATVNIKHFIYEVLDSLDSLAAQKSLKVRVQVDPALQSIETDPQHLRTILTNLLSNAFKYTASGEVAVWVSLTTLQTCEFRVRDTGPGIPLDQQSQVFDEFRRLEGAATRQAGGTGLGLAICKRLTNLLGGQISLESVLGQGSTFTVRLPTVSPRTLQALGADQNVKVLFIEADLQVQQRVATYLSERPYHLLFAPDSIEGIQIARKEHPNAIVLDPNSPNAETAKVRSELLNNSETAIIPLLLQSLRDEGSSLALNISLEEALHTENSMTDDCDTPSPRLQ